MLPLSRLFAGFAGVFYVPKYITKGIQLRNLWSLWNLALSAFSILGASRTVPHLVNALRTEGFVHTVCTPPETWYLRGATGFWVTLFIFSKIPELLDTVFLVLQNKEVIFLHWFHHVTVLLYCWHAFISDTATGLWFCASRARVKSNPRPSIVDDKTECAASRAPSREGCPPQACLGVASARKLRRAATSFQLAAAARSLASLSLGGSRP